MSMDEPNIVQIERAVSTSMSKHWPISLVEGIILVILGLIAIVVPRTLAIEIQFGWLFLISGVTGLVTTFLMRAAPGFFWSLVSAILAITAGVIIVFSPTQMLSLTLILIVFFVIEGVASILFALNQSREGLRRWGWMLVSGTIDLCLAATILVGLPGSAKWAVGLLVGVNLISGGVALIAIALTGRDPAPAG
jgi:uncharacterized membrane protein HdeD (DUF308 family)